MARLAGLDNISSTTAVNHNAGPVSPNTPGPSKAFTGQIISPSKQQQLQNQAEMPMEVEESNEKQCNTSGVDVDSGIENMEVEESDRKDSKSRSRVSIMRIVILITWMQASLQTIILAYLFRLQVPAQK